MQIAVDVRGWESDKTNEVTDFTTKVFSTLAVQQPEHHFLFIVDAVINKPCVLPQNVTIITVTPKPKNFLIYKWWYDVKLPLALKKIKADVFIASSGLASLTTNIPTVLVVRDLAFLQKTATLSSANATFYKNFTGSFIKKSTALVTLSDFVKVELLKRYMVKKAVTTVGSGTGSHYKPVEWEEREAIKERHAKGCEYFVFTGGSQNLLHVLKAFSIFKKWQKTNMKLVIAGKFDAAFEKDLDKLNTYKYRDEVIVKDNIENETIAPIVAASYAMIYPSFYEGFAVPVLAAMYCEVPVITSPDSSMSEIGGEAALYAAHDNPAEIAEQLKRIFKDEQLRSTLIEAARQRAKLFTWDKTAALLWQVIEETVSR